MSGELFGEVRSILAGARRRYDFGRLCDALDQADPEVVERDWWAYLTEHLREWSAWDRYASRKWSAAMYAGEWAPMYALACYIDDPCNSYECLDVDDWLNYETSAKVQLAEELYELFPRRVMENSGRPDYVGFFQLPGEERDLLVRLDPEEGEIHVMLRFDGRVRLIERSRCGEWTLALIEEDEVGESWRLYDRTGVCWRQDIGQTQSFSGAPAHVAAFVGGYVVMCSEWEGIVRRVDLESFEQVVLEDTVMTRFQVVDDARCFATLRGPSEIALLDVPSLSLVWRERCATFPIDLLCFDPVSGLLCALERGDAEEFWYSSEDLRVASVHVWRVLTDVTLELLHSTRLYSPLRRPPAEFSSPQETILHARKSGFTGAALGAMDGGVRAAIFVREDALYVFDYPSLEWRRVEVAGHTTGPFFFVAGGRAVADQFGRLFWCGGEPCE